MQEWIIEIMNTYGYLGVLLLIAAENLFPPIPSEIILTFCGFMTTHAEMNVWISAIYATLGSVIGAVALYYIGRIFHADRLDAWVMKYGKVLRVGPGDIHKAEAWFNRRGTSAVFFCRFIPIVRSLISIPAGMAKMDLGRFIIYTTLGSAAWNVVLIQLGSFAGENWAQIAGYLDKYSTAAMIVILAGLLSFIIWHIQKNRKKS